MKGQVIGARSADLGDDEFSLFLGIDAKAIGQIGGGKRKPTGHLDVAMLQYAVTP